LALATIWLPQRTQRTFFLRQTLFLPRFTLQEEHGVEDVLVGGHGVGWDEQEDSEPF